MDTLERLCSLGAPDIFVFCSKRISDFRRRPRSRRNKLNGRRIKSARDGVHCYDKAGQMIGKIKIPEIVSNICFGGSKLNRLFITGTTSLYSIYLAINGKAF